MTTEIKRRTEQAADRGRAFGRAYARALIARQLKDAPGEMDRIPWRAVILRLGIEGAADRLIERGHRHGWYGERADYDLHAYDRARKLGRWLQEVQPDETTREGYSLLSEAAEGGIRIGFAQVMEDHLTILCDHAAGEVAQ